MFYNASSDKPLDNFVDKKWRIDETQANIVRQIFKDYLGGMRLKNIADKLNNNGIRTASNKQFTVNILSRLMHNEKYIGIINADEQYTNIVPAIINKETFETAVAKLDLNKRRAAVNKAPILYLLSGKLYCGHCDTLMTGDSGKSKTGKRHNYYKCFKRKKDRLACDKKAIQKDWIEKKVVDRTVKFLLEQPVLLRSIARNTADTYNKDLQDTAILESMTKQHGEAEKAIANLLKALEMGIFSPSTKDRLDELEQQKETIEAEMLLKHIFQAKPIDEDAVYKYFLSFADLDYSIQKNRERLIEMFVRKVVLCDTKDEPDISYNIFSDNGDIKENADSETEFGVDALGGTGGAICELRSRENWYGFGLAV